MILNFDLKIELIVRFSVNYLPGVFLFNSVFSPGESSSSSSKKCDAVSGDNSQTTSATVSKDKRQKTIQDDPKVSAVYKSLFNTHETAKRQQKAHWVTYNPQYF